MNDLDQMILNLKSQGKSLRQIGSDLHLSHEAIRKRLNVLSSRDHVSTRKRDKGLTPSTIENERGSIGSNPHKSMTSEKIRGTVNQMSTQKTPSVSLNESVNPLETPSDKLPEHPECMKGVYQGVDSESGDLFKGIKDFLEANGIEVYRINVEPEGYQVKNNGQTIRIYVQRKMEEPKSRGER